MLHTLYKKKSPNFYNYEYKDRRYWQKCHFAQRTHVGWKAIEFGDTGGITRKIQWHIWKY